MRKLSGLWRGLVLVAIVGFMSTQARAAIEVYVTSADSPNVFKYNAAGTQTGVIPPLSGQTTNNYGPGLEMGYDGYLYVTHTGDNQVTRFDPNTLSGTGAPYPITNTLQPTGLGVYNGFIYTADRVDDSIRKYNVVTGADLGSFVKGSYFTGYHVPTDMAFVGNNGYISYYGLGGTDTGQIVKVDLTTGAMSLFASGGSLKNPTGLAVGADGKLYVASYGTNSVLAYDLTTAASSTFISAGGLYLPYDLQWGPDGLLYVASEGNNSVLKYTNTGVSAGTAISGISRPLYLAVRDNAASAVPLPTGALLGLVLMAAIGLALVARSQFVRQAA